MTSSRRILVLSTAAALAALGGGDAAAGGERVHKSAVLEPAPAGRMRGARIDVVRRTMQDQMIRVRTRDGVRGDSFLVFIADDHGALTQVGEADFNRRIGRVEWKVRTARGDALPFGVPDVAFLSGRALQLRTAAGQIVVSGVVPAAQKATGIPLRMKSLKQALVVDEAAGGAGAEARILVVRHHDQVSLEIQFECDATGLALEAWVKQADGTEAKLGDLTQQTATGDDGDDDDADDATGEDADDDDANDLDKAATVDDDSDDDAAPQFRYELVVDSTTSLPFGATSLADLAGLAIEIRNGADSSVLASGFLPDVSAPDAVDDDDQGDDNDEQGDDDQGEDEDGDD